MKKILLLSFLISFNTQPFKAQSIFGWNFSLDYNSINIKDKPALIQSVAQKFAIDKSGGFSLGIPLNIKLANLVILRPQLVFNVSMGQLDYKLPSGEPTSTKFPSLNVEVPFQAVISNFSKFHGLALILGLKGGYKLADLIKDQEELFSKSYGSFDTGLGYRIKIGKKTRMIEMRYSLGLNVFNQKITDANSLANKFESLRRNRISFIINTF
jgi:hypothetical protein